MRFTEFVPLPEPGSRVWRSMNKIALKAFMLVGRPVHKVQFGLSLVTVFSALFLYT